MEGGVLQIHGVEVAVPKSYGGCYRVCRSGRKVADLTISVVQSVNSPYPERHSGIEKCPREPAAKPVNTVVPVSWRLQVGVVLGKSACILSWRTLLCVITGQNKPHHCHC